MTNLDPMYIHAVRFMDIMHGYPMEYAKGRQGVVSIHYPNFIPEGAKEYINILFDNGDVLRLYNYDHVLLKPKTDENTRTNPSED